MVILPPAFKGMVHIIYYREAKDTLSAIEMDIGDILVFKLRNGQERRINLLDTAAYIVETNMVNTMVENPSGGTVLRFTCRIYIDGHEMSMERYICTQESFYAPYVINGMRIWFDGVMDIFNLVNECHGACGPKKRARFAFNDAADSICPQKMVNWYPNEKNFIFIGDSYNGEDCWMGPYFGASCHGGLDVNHPRGTPLWVPFDIDYQYLFDSVEAGDNNNRWRGVRRWPDGTLWTIQSHHLIKMLVPRHIPLNAGTHYAEAAGVYVGTHDHSHFEFRITENGDEVLLDPWILFWEIFENNKKNSGVLKADMESLSPGKTGTPVSFFSKGGTHGKNEAGLQFHWTFGDGGYSNEENPVHIYAKQGIYPVTLLVNDGIDKASFTQHITIDGQDIAAPCFILEAEDETSFRCRPVHIMDVYGRQPEQVPYTLTFTARQSKPVPDTIIVKITNIGTGVLNSAEFIIKYKGAKDWMKAELRTENGMQFISVAVDGTDMRPDAYQAQVAVHIDGALNSPQVFNIVMNIPESAPEADVIIDDQDKGFYCTPYFWVGHHFCNWPGKKGYKGYYLVNGCRPGEGEFARFTPDLQEGSYEVCLSRETPFTSDSILAIRVHAKAEDVYLKVKPSEALLIGVFDFNEGCDGFVEIHSKGSKGQVYADAVIFKRINV